MRDLILSVRGLAAGYGNRRVIEGIDLDVAERDVLLILGHNGAGKTTLVRTIFSLITPKEGRVTFRGTDITGQVPARSVAMGIAFVPQGHGVFPRLTVHENLALGGFSVGDRAAAAQRAKAAFDMFPILEERASQIAGTLSGGQQQMLAIAMALQTSPRLLILDEPSIGLAPKLVSTVMESIKFINEQMSTTIMLVEQNVTAALPIAHRVIILKTGAKIFDGFPAEVESQSKLMEYY